jgi:hypothetical protein
MAESKFLFGASVQGIQDFIFSTNKLKEIIGASALIEKLCKDFFIEQIKNLTGSYDSSNLLLSAAGNMKYLFDSELHCKKFVKSFLKNASDFAPGIRVVQATVKINGESLKSADFDLLEERLQIQKNKFLPQLNLGWMAFERSRKTGKPAISWNENVALDKAQIVKKDNSEHKQLLNKIFPSDIAKNYHFKYPYELEHFSSSWMAVVHADGNNLGIKIQAMADFYTNNQAQTKGHSFHEALKAFSETIDKATEQAAQDAFNAVILPVLNDIEVLPLRPVLLGGDDITLIIEAKYAFAFTHEYLSSFEKQTKIKFASFQNTFGFDGFNDGFTACAGIAYIKKSYPFHYGAELSEVLCSAGKKVAKRNTTKAPSCLYFYKVHSSYVTSSYDDLVKKELTIKFNPGNSIRIDGGPYFVNERDQSKTVAFLAGKVKALLASDAPKSPIRNWLSILHKNPHQADLVLERINSVHKNFIGFSKVDCFFEQNGQKEVQFTWVADAMTLTTFN